MRITQPSWLWLPYTPIYTSIYTFIYTPIYTPICTPICTPVHTHTHRWRDCGLRGRHHPLGVCRL